jgi:hypothetical protein
MNTTARCILRHNTPTRATHGHLCHGHNQRILDTLTDLLTWWAMLDEVIEPGSTQETNARGRRIDPPAPLRLEVVAVRDQRTIALHDGDLMPVLFVIGEWARLVREERDLALPTSLASVVTEVGTLRDHHDWIVAQDWVDDYYAEMCSCARCLRNVVGIQGPISVGPCPIIYEHGPCTGKLYQDRWGGMSVSCNKCHAHWDDRELRRLGLVIGAAAQ